MRMKAGVVMRTFLVSLELIVLAAGLVTPSGRSIGDKSSSSQYSDNSVLLLDRAHPTAKDFNNVETFTSFTHKVGGYSYEGEAEEGKFSARDGHFMEVGGDSTNYFSSRMLSTSSNWNSNVQLNGDEDFNGEADLQFKARSDVQLNVGSDVNVNGGSDLKLNGDSDVQLNAGSDVRLNAGSDVRLNAGSDVRLNAGSDVRLNAGSDVQLNAGSNVILNAGLDLDFNSHLNLDSSSKEYLNPDVRLNGSPKVHLNGKRKALAKDPSSGSKKNVHLNGNPSLRSSGNHLTSNKNVHLNGNKNVYLNENPSVYSDLNRKVNLDKHSNVVKNVNLNVGTNNYLNGNKYVYLEENPSVHSNVNKNVDLQDNLNVNKNVNKNVHANKNLNSSPIRNVHANPNSNSNLNVHPKNSNPDPPVTSLASKRIARSELRFVDSSSGKSGPLGSANVLRHGAGGDVVKVESGLDPPPHRLHPSLSSEVGSGSASHSSNVVTVDGGVIREKRVDDRGAKSKSKKPAVFIAGFFPTSFNVSKGSVGRGVLPAVRLAVHHINENSNVLGDYVLHISWNNTKCDAAEGMKSFFDAMHQKPSKIMLFGDACKSVTDPIAKASKHWKIAQLSYADMHPMFSKKNYPNLFRIVPSENEFNAPRIQLLKMFNWTLVGTLYQNNPRYSLAHNRLVADLEVSGVKVVAAQSFADDITYQLQQLKEKDVRIILGNFNETWARRIFCEAYREKLFGKKYQWLIVGTYSRQWWRKEDVNCSLREIETALKGAILMDLLPLSTSQEISVSGRTAGEYKELYDVVSLGEYSRFHGYAYDGIWAIALALQNISSYFEEGSGIKTRRSDLLSTFRYRDDAWEKAFLSALEATSFIGVTGLVQFRDNGRKGSVLIKQFQAFNTVNAEVKVGEYDGVTATLSLLKGQNITWNGKSPPKDRTYTEEVHTRVNITLFAAMATASSAGILLASFFLAVNIRFRNQRYIKMSSPYLNNLIIIGCILTYTSIIILGLDSKLTSESAFPYICTARAWILMAGFTLAFGSMFSKTWRVHSIFTNVKLNKKVIKDMQLFIVVGILLAIDFAIMTTWHFIDPFYRETKKMEGYTDPTNDDVKIIPVNEYCKSHHMNIFVGCIYAYKGLLMIFGCFLAWETRHVSIPALNDSKYIGMSVYNSVMMCLIGAPLSHVLSDKQDASFVIISIFIIFCTTATLCLVFLPKLIELKRNPNGTIEKRLRTTIKPPFATRRTSATSLYETELKSAKQLNQKYRKQIREIDNEIQALAKILGDDAQEILHDAMHNLALPKSEVLKKEDTDVSSLYSLNSDGGDDADVFIESPQKKRSAGKYPGGLPAPWEAVTAGVLNSAKTILFAPELGSVVSKSDSGAPVEQVPSVTTTSPSEEPITVEEKSLPKRLPQEEKRRGSEQSRLSGNRQSPPTPGQVLPPTVPPTAPHPPLQPTDSSGRPTETLMDLYSQLPLKSNFQPIQYPLQSRLNKSEYDIIHIEGGGPRQDGLGIIISAGDGSLSRAKKSSVSESHLTVIMGPAPGQTGDAAAASSTTQEEIWAMLQKERRYIERNIYCEENEVVITEMPGMPSSSSSGGVSFLSKSKMASSFEDNHQIQELQPVVGSTRHLRKLSAPVLPLAMRRQQNRDGSQIINLPPLVQGGSSTGLTEAGAGVVVVETSRRASSSGKETKRLKSPTQQAAKPGGLRLKTDYDDDQEIIFSSSCDLPNFSSSTGHIDHCSSRGEHHTSSVRLSSGRGHSSQHSGVNHSSSEDIQKGHHHLRGGISTLRGGGRISPGDGTSKQTLSKYRSYSVPKRLDNSVLNFSEINLDVSLLPIFHKILSERRSLRDSHHHRHHTHTRTVDRSKKADKEKFMVSCPNIMIKCDIVEYL